MYGETPPGIYYSYIRSEHQLTTSYSKDKTAHDIRTNSDKGTTLAPRPRWDALSLSQQADTLRSYLNFSCMHGWVTHHGICNSLQAKMRNVAKQLGKGKIKQAINGLNAFIHEVRAQRGKYITSEGYAVLFYNARYLIRQLKKQSGGKKENKDGKKKNKGRKKNRK